MLAYRERNDPFDLFYDGGIYSPDELKNENNRN